MDRWLYQRYRRNLHRPERPTRPRPDVLAWWIAAPIRAIAWALE